MSGAQAWAALLAAAAPVFTAPSAMIFCDLVAGWVLSPGRRTVTRMICAADPEGRRSHDAYHRFLRAGRWSMAALWKALATRVVSSLCPPGPISLDLDDTLYHKTGPRVDGAGIFRDAVRSTSKYVVHALGLNLVVLTVRVAPPWGSVPLGLPVSVRLHRKGGPTPPDLAEEMIVEVASWFPDRAFELSADGAYATLAGRGLPRTSVTSRMRRDAALFGPVPPRTGKRGRPRTKGERLPAPPVMAARARAGWVRTEVDIRGRVVERLLLCRDVLWYGVCRHAMVRLVVVRDPSGREPDDFLFTTDLEARPDDVVNRYAGRWSIECTFRDTKQHLGGEDPQCWKGKGPERAAALSLWLHAAVWLWYIGVHGTERTWIVRPWYRAKRVPSFADALAALRRALWADRITQVSFGPGLMPKTAHALIEILAQAA